MPLAHWQSALDAIGYVKDPSEAPNTDIGLLFGRAFHLFGSQHASQLYHRAATFNVLEEVVTIANAATTTTANTSILPANSLILAVLCRVTVVIPTAATFTVGVSGQASRFATGVTVAANSTSVGFLQWNPAVASDALGPRQTANAGVLITPSAPPTNNSGRVRVVVVYLGFAVPVA